MVIYDRGLRLHNSISLMNSCKQMFVRRGHIILDWIQILTNVLVCAYWIVFICGV